MSVTNLNVNGLNSPIKKEMDRMDFQNKIGTGEMAQWFRVLAMLSENSGYIPTCPWWLTTMISVLEDPTPSSTNLYTMVHRAYIPAKHTYT